VASTLITPGFDNGSLSCNSNCLSFNTGSCFDNPPPVVTPTAIITSPSNGAVVSSSDVDVGFSVSDWVVGGKGGNHTHFHLDGSSDHLMFYNSPDDVVEFNLVVGPTGVASWVDSSTVRFNGLSDGSHTIRMHLANFDHDIPGNSEADTMITITVNTTIPPPPSNADFGDLNGDDRVDILDVMIVVRDFGRSSGFDPLADRNGDGRIDIFDLVRVARYWGKRYGTDVDVPVVLNSVPSGVLRTGTTSVLLKVLTDERAYCKYSNVSGTGFVAMGDFVKIAYNTVHAIDLVGLVDGNIYYYVLCEDESGNFMVSEYVVNFTIGTPPAAAVCGDGVVEGVEVCDGSDLRGQTCQRRGFDNGTLACSVTCDSFDLGGCFDNPPPPDGTVLFFEDFENPITGGSCPSPGTGWYDLRSPRIVSASPRLGSALEMTFDADSQTPNTGLGRHLFTPSDSVYLSYWVKYSDNWVGSRGSSHPHESSFLSDVDGNCVGGAGSQLSVLIEQNHCVRTNSNVCPVAETGMIPRLIAPPRFERPPDSSDLFTDDAGPRYKGDWHFVEVYLEMNSAGGDWLDDDLFIDLQDVVFRSVGQDSFLFGQFFIAPYIGVGSPITQTMWVDDLTVATSR